METFFLIGTASLEIIRASVFVVAIALSVPRKMATADTRNEQKNRLRGLRNALSGAFCLAYRN